MQSIISLFSQRFHERAAEIDRERGYVKHYKIIFKKTEEEIKNLSPYAVPQLNSIYIRRLTHTQRKTILTIIVFKATPEEFLDIAEEILKLPLLKYYKTTTFSLAYDGTDSLSINYNWNKTDQKYYSLCTDLTKEQVLQKVYKNHAFFSKCDIEKASSQHRLEVLYLN